MIKKYITVAGISSSTKIVDGDRESDQGNVILLVLDKHLEIQTVFRIIKRNHPTAILISNGLLSITPNKILMLDGTDEDQSILDNHLLGDQLAIVVTVINCFYTRNINNIDLINTKYPLGKLHSLVKIVNTIS